MYIETVVEPLNTWPLKRLFLDHLERTVKTDPEQIISRTFIEAGVFTTIVKLLRDTDVPLDDDSQLAYSLGSTCFRLLPRRQR